jgi:DNA-directed RNA polymerase subunit RPC12/RpoP
MEKRFIILLCLKIFNLVRKNFMGKREKYRCKSCGMEFFKPSRKPRKKKKKGITCPYCGSELYHNLITK